jgi:hypothetical protein
MGESALSFSYRRGNSPPERVKMANKVSKDNLYFLLDWLSCYDAEDEERIKEIEILTKWLNKQIERKG